MTSDGLRTFEYDESRRLSKVKILQNGEAASVDYLHNALGQRVFKSVPLAEQTLPDERRLGRGFIEWLREGFGWLFTKGRGGKSSIGQGFAYDENANLLGEYDNGSAQGLGTTEYIWLPVEGANAIPMGIYRNGKLYQVHADHLGTPRLVTDSANAPVWQWPYSASGNNKTTGVLTTTTTTTSGGQERLRATKAPVAVNLRFPGQYFDEESNLAYNYMRSYRAGDGRYTQADPIGLVGGVNRFGYVGGNPVARIDPLGLQAFMPGPRGMPIPLPRPLPRARDGRGGYDPRTDVFTAPSPLLTDLLRQWMDARGASDPQRPPDANPGRDCDGKCNPCPPDPVGWAHDGDAHGSTGGRHYHRWKYNQDPTTCICRAGRRSGPGPM